MKKLLALTMALAMVLALAACGSSNSGSAAPAASADKSAGAASASGSAASDGDAIPGTEDGVLTVGMECAYAPYNWTQSDDSNGAVPIANDPGAYANGYDVMIAKKICEANGWELEDRGHRLGFGLVPAVQAGTMDAVIAGQSMTDDAHAAGRYGRPLFLRFHRLRHQEGQPLCSRHRHLRADGGTCTAQTGTIWYDSCLPQIEGAQHADSAPRPLPP